MDLRQAITEIGKTIPGQFEPQKDGSARMEAVIAERKAFLSKKKLTYICHFKVDEPAKEVRFFEMLKESGFGVTSGGGGDEMSTGFGFKKETYNTFGKERTGSIEEQSKLFGKDYSYNVRFRVVPGGRAQSGRGRRIPLRGQADGEVGVTTAAINSNGAPTDRRCPVFLPQIQRLQAPILCSTGRTREK